VLLLLVLVGIFSCIVVAASHGAYRAALHHQRLVQARALAGSALQRAEFFLNGGDGHDFYWEADSFSEPFQGVGVLEMSCARFGVYSRFVGIGRAHEVTSRLDGILGRTMLDSLYPVITLTGGVSGLLIADQCRVTGRVVFDNGQIGRGYTKQPIAGAEKWVTNRKSPTLPFETAPIDSEFARLGRLLDGSAGDTASANPGPDSASVTHRIEAPTIMLSGDAECPAGLLDRTTVVCAGTLRFTESTTAHQCTFVADRVRVEGGRTRASLFYGRDGIDIRDGDHDSQFMSTDSIAAGKDVTFGSTALLISRRTVVRDSVCRGGVFLADDGEFAVTAVSYADSVGRTSMRMRGAAVSVGRRSRYTGVIICDGLCVLGSQAFHGHLWAQSLWGVGSDGVLSPYFLQCTVVDTLGADRLFPLIGEAPAQVRFVRIDPGQAP
jgi:hypothetical protein